MDKADMRRRVRALQRLHRRERAHPQQEAERDTAPYAADPPLRAVMRRGWVH